MLAHIVYNPESHNETLSFSVTNASLFNLPGGAAGIAATAEFGNQGYDLNTDPKATGDSFYYWGWKDQDGHGSRNRWALASELRMPVLDSLNLSVAGRYDQRSEEHTSELQSLMRISYAVFCLTKKTKRS